MTDLRWLEGLHARVNDATTALDSMAMSVHGERRRVIQHLESIVDHVGRGHEAREHKLMTELHDRVMGAFGSGRLADLSLREQRYASKQFRHASAAQMQALLAHFPAAWHGFATECFRSFELLCEVPDAAGYMRLLCLAPKSVAFMHQLGRPQDLVGVEGPTRVARSLSGGCIREARDALQARGLDPAWSFTAIALAMWVKLQVDAGDRFERVWCEVREDALAESMLLPRLDGEARSWFSNAPRPARVRGALAASAVFVAALIQASRARGVDAVMCASFAELLLRSEFRDPRVPPESSGWRKVKQFDQRVYNGFLEQLISDDLEVFFAHAMVDPRRKHFWLRYLSQIRRTVCILDRVTHERLTRQLAGADKKLAGAIARARRFDRRGSTATVQAFCLYFDTFVVVEFSETGNAAYVYERAQFERELGPSIETNKISDHARLKRVSAVDRILHQHDWETSATQKLLELQSYRRR